MDARRLLRNISSQWVTHAVMAVAGLLLPPFYLDTLGRDAYGVNNLIGDLGGYSAVLYLGLGSAILKFVAEHNARGDLDTLNETVSSIFAVYLGLGLFCLLAAVGLTVPLPSLFQVSPELVGQARARLVMTGVMVCVEFVGSVYGGVLMGVERFDVLNAIKLGGFVARNAGVVLALSRWPSLVTVGLVFVAGSVAEQVAMFFYARRVLPGLRVSLALYRPTRLRSLFTFSAQSFLFTMSERVINYTDSVVIAQARGAGSTAAYALPLRLVEFSREFLDRATFVLMPGFSAAAARGELHRAQAYWRTGSKLLMALAAPIALVQVLWGRHVLALWLSRNDNAAEAAAIVAEGAACMSWLAAAFVMQMAGRGLARPLFEGLGELRVPARIVVAEAALNLALSIVLVRTWGLTGVAFATFLPAAITGVVVMPWFVCRRLGASYARHLVDTFGRTALPLAPAWWVLHEAERAGYHQRLLPMALTCLAVLGVYLLGAFAVAFDADERRLVTSRFR